jgi:hypothetical protein
MAGMRPGRHSFLASIFAATNWRWLLSHNPALSPVMATLHAWGDLQTAPPAISGLSRFYNMFTRLRRLGLTGGVRSVQVSHWDRFLSSAELYWNAIPVGGLSLSVNA